MSQLSAGAAFRQALAEEKPLQIIGAINANHALLAKRAGFKAIYLSGGGVAAGSLGLPDLGINTLDDVLTDIRRITDVCDVPLLVDIDTGFGPSAFNIARTVKSLIKFGAAACHIEDQAGAKRCGHRPNKEIVSTEEMTDRVKAAVDAKTDADFYIIARTDAIQSFGVEAALERAQKCAEAGADVIINLPTMKVHYATGITLSLKNLKGFLPPEEKKHFHEIGLDLAIVDLNKAITTQLTIVDAIQAMERMGPRGGDIVSLNLIMAGENNWEVDWVGMNIMGYRLSEVKHLCYYLEDLNIDEQRIQEIIVVGESIENAQYPFKKVSMEAIIPPTFTLYQTNACSACMNALLLSCSFLEGIPTVLIDVFLGSNIVEFPSNHHLRLSFGNCCTRKTDIPLSIPGCPPYPFNLNLLLKQRGLIKKGEK